MHLKSLLLLLTALTSAFILPRQSSATFSVTNFQVYGDWPSKTTNFSLDVEYNGDKGSCNVARSITEVEPCGVTPPGNAEVAGPFNETRCGDSRFMWSLTNTSSPLPFGSEGLSLKIVYDDGKSDSLTACRFLDYKYTCTFDLSAPSDPGYDTKLLVDTNLTMTAQSFSECIYA